MTKAGLLATVFATLFGASALAQEPIRIGAINPYSGPVALYGDEVARGYQLAIDEANAKGGVIGRKALVMPMRPGYTARARHTLAAGIDLHQNAGRVGNVTDRRVSEPLLREEARRDGEQLLASGGAGFGGGAKRGRRRTSWGAHGCWLETATTSPVMYDA